LLNYYQIIDLKLTFF